MKGEFAEDQDENHHHHSLNPNNNNNKPMFPNFPPPHSHTHTLSRAPKFQPPPPPHPHPFSLSDESDSVTPPSTKKPKTEDGGSVEVGRRPRGRPPGSKNKPKPPLVITRDTEPPMAPYILEIPTDSDIVDCLTRFTRRRDIGLCVLAASGAVMNVTLKQPSTATPGGTVTFHGRFDILSLSAVLLNTAPFGGNNGGGFAFTISLAGPQGQIVGGKVVGPLLSSGTIYVIAASFNSPTYHRLPIDGGEQDVAAGDNGPSGSPVSGGGDGGGGGGGPVGLYSCHMGSSSNSDVIWAPTATARPPPPPPY